MAPQEILPFYGKQTTSCPYVSRVLRGVMAPQEILPFYGKQTTSCPYAQPGKSGPHP